MGLQQRRELHMARDAHRGWMGRLALGLGLGVGVMSTLAAGCGTPSQANSIAVTASDQTNASGSFRAALTSRTTVAATRSATSATPLAQLTEAGPHESVLALVDLDHQVAQLTVGVPLGPVHGAVDEPTLARLGVATGEV